MGRRHAAGDVECRRTGRVLQPAGKLRDERPLPHDKRPRAPVASGRRLGVYRERLAIPRQRCGSCDDRGGLAGGLLRQRTRRCVFLRRGLAVGLGVQAGEPYERDGLRSLRRQLELLGPCRRELQGAAAGRDDRLVVSECPRQAQRICRLLELHCRSRTLRHQLSQRCEERRGRQRFTDCGGIHRRRRHD